MNKKALVTGGCGFIGSHLVDALIDQGHEVDVIDNQSAECNEKFFTNPKASYHVASIEEYEQIEPLFKNIDYVFHLAAESRIQPTLEHPQKACLTNFVGTCNILQASRLNNVKRVIYSSTSSGYGLVNEPPLVETMRRDCLNPYSVTKVAAEDLCKMYYTLWGLQTVILRYFNVYGERQPLKGQYAPVVGIFLRQNSNNEPMTIVGDGLQRRDFTHVADVVQSNMLSAESQNEKIFGEVFNVGTGTNHTILEISKMIGDKCVHLPKRPGEADSTLADISKIQDYLGYKPTIKIPDWINKQKS